MRQISSQAQTPSCCGYPTLGAPRNYEICQICDLTDDRDSGSGPEAREEARENFRAYLTKYRPVSNAFKAHDLESERAAKRELVRACDAYMAEPDLHRRTTLWSKVHRLSGNFPLGDPAGGN